MDRLSRAERRRIKKAANKKVPTYNMNPEQIMGLKSEAESKSARTAFTMMLGISVLTLKDHFDDLKEEIVDGKKREERFTDYCIDFYNLFDKGYYTLEDIEKVLYDECGLTIKEN